MNVRCSEIYRLADVRGSVLRLQVRVRPSFRDRTRPLVSRTCTCCSTAASDMDSGSPSSLTDAGPWLSRSSMRRRPGSASARKTRSRSSPGSTTLLSTCLSMVSNRAIVKRPLEYQVLPTGLASRHHQMKLTTKHGGPDRGRPSQWPGVRAGDPHHRDRVLAGPPVPGPWHRHRHASDHRRLRLRPPGRAARDIGGLQRQRGIGIGEQEGRLHGKRSGHLGPGKGSPSHTSASSYRAATWSAANTR